MVSFEMIILEKFGINFNTCRKEVGRCDGTRIRKSSWDSGSREEGGSKAGGEEERRGIL